MRRVTTIVIALAGALSLGTLAGCTGEDLFDALGSQVDPYAQKATGDQQGQPAAQPQPAPAPQPSVPTAADPAGTTVTDPAAASPDAAPSPDPAVAPARSTEEHMIDEAVTIDLGGDSTIFATWTLDDNGDWAAVFGTYNGTILYSYQDVEGGWTFYTVDGREVVHTDTSSTDEGEYGPDGVPSNWRAADGSAWY